MKPDMLYYNCQAPLKIVIEQRIRTSKIDKRDRGISMSSWSELGSHGPFKIAFWRAPWFGLFTQVQYGPHPHKNPMFETEQEWHCPHDIVFQMKDVLYVMFMKNAPCLLGPRQLRAVRNGLLINLPSGAYREGNVNDAYLERSS